MVFLRKPDPVLAEMPTNVMERIVEMGRIEDRFTMRKVSRSLRSQIDSMHLQLEELAIWIHDDNACFDLILPNLRYLIDYRDHLDGCTVRKEDFSNGEDDEKREILMPECQFWDLAARDLSIILGNSKLKILSFKITMNKSIFSDLFFQRLLVDQKLNSWSCKHLITRYDGPDIDLIPLISHLSSAHLASIQFEKMDPKKKIKEIIGTTQWKNAQFLDIEHIERMMDFKDWKHFKVVTMGVDELSFEQFLEIFEHFSTTHTMQRCSIGVHKTIDLEKMRPLLETSDLKMDPTRRFTREFKNLKFSVTVGVTGVQFKRV